MRARSPWCLLAASLLLTTVVGREALSQQLESQTPPVPQSIVTIADADPLVQPVATRWDVLAAAASGCGACGELPCPPDKVQALEKAAVGAYKGVFFDNNFEYLCDPCYDGWHLGENFKQLGVAPWMTVDLGGQYRARLHNERNIRNAAPIGLGLTGADDDFLLHRTRLYADAQIGPRVRVYAEMLDAVSEFENYAPRPIDENRVEMQNLFIDLVALDGPSGTLTARFGRQELLLGVQRLVSPLDWGNTRRTFEGARLLWKGENWDADGLWVRPMRHEVLGLDPPDLDRQLYGLYTTYKALEEDKLDLYWLALDYQNVGTAPDRGFRYDTLGARVWGGRDAWLYEAEGGVQFGTNVDDSDHAAGFFTLGLGHKFAACWKPTLWAYYDWASGDDTVNNGFHHYEPLAHRYLGFMDLFGRRNIEDANLLLTLQPQERLQLLLWYHYFWLQNGNDVPYTAVMTPYAGLTSGTGVRDLGHEIDLVATWSITARTELLFGYSHFFAGDFYDSLPSDLPDDADFFYTQFTVNF